MKLKKIIALCADILSTEAENSSLSVGKKRSMQDLKIRMDFRLPRQGRSETELVEDMKSFLRLTPNTRTPQFQNQLFSGLHPFALAGEWLATFANSTMATFEVAPFATLAEKELVSHLHSKIGWTDGDGIMVTGGSNANFLAMLVARNTLFPDTKVSGNGNRRFVAFVSEEAHYSFDKAVNMLGLGLDSLRKVPSDERGKMDPVILRDMIGNSIERGETPFFIAATAGTTVLGAFDPLQAIGQVARDFKLWFHVDGAWGGSVILSRKHRALMSGIEAADSLTLDTHKVLGTGLISSFFLTRHAHVLRRSNDSGGADYIFHEKASSTDLGPSSLQCGRRADSFKVWLMWRSVGDEGIEAMIDGLFEKTVLARDLIDSNPNLVLLNEPEMLNVCFGYRDGEIDLKAARERLLADGEFYVNVSTRRGKTFFRMILVNPELNARVISHTLNHIIEAGKNHEKV